MEAENVISIQRLLGWLNSEGVVPTLESLQKGTCILSQGQTRLIQACSYFGNLWPEFFDQPTAGKNLALHCWK